MAITIAIVAAPRAMPPMIDRNVFMSLAANWPQTEALPEFLSFSSLRSECMAF